MKKERNEDNLSRLPKEFADRFTQPFSRFVRIESAAAVILLTFAALALSNSSWSRDFTALWQTSIGVSIGSFEFSRSLQQLDQ